MMRLVTFLVLALFAPQLVAQTDAQVRSRKIRSVETEIYEVRKGKSEKVKIRETYTKDGFKMYMKWNEEGVKVVSESHWVRRDGQDAKMTENDPLNDSVKKIHIYTYDRFGKLIKEVITDENGNLLETEEMTYGVRGEKLTETIRNAENKVVRETNYTYDSKGMLLQKVTKDGEGKVIYEKKVTYEY